MKTSKLPLIILLLAFTTFNQFGLSQTKEFENIQIGNQIWMAENLNVSTFRNGDTIPEVNDPEIWKTLKTPAWCYYDNSEANGKVYGKLYNWYAVNDPRGLAPEGYRIPSNADWAQLIIFLGGEDVGGGKLKEPGLAYWNKPNEAATNDYQFTGRGGGRYANGFFDYKGIFGIWWSSTAFDDTFAWYYSLNYKYAFIKSYVNFQRTGFSVRCVKE
jgi:uncharacterized protein (TIGR02145 family)